jgi:hypothetical protein
MIASASFLTVFPIIVAAVVSIGTAVAGVVTWFVNGVRAERTRLQKLYADSYSAVVSYQEFPYVIRRRRAPTAEQPEIGGEERLRITGALHAVQEELNNYSAQISTESKTVSTKYDLLVSKTRQIAGMYMHEAWDATPLDNDAGMNIAGIDYKELRTPQDDYLEAVKQDMTFWRVAIPKLRN